MLSRLTESLADRYRLDREIGDGPLARDIVLVDNWFPELRAKMAR
jgi:hypothetical protein